MPNEHRHVLDGLPDVAFIHVQGGQPFALIVSEDGCISKADVWTKPPAHADVVSLDASMVMEAHPFRQSDLQPLGDAFHYTPFVAAFGEGRMQEVLVDRGPARMPVLNQLNVGLVPPGMDNPQFPKIQA